MTAPDEELALLSQVDQHHEVHRDSTPEEEAELKRLYGPPVQGYYTGTGREG